MNKEAYNNIATQWAEFRDKSFVSQLIMDFSEKLKPGAKVLDIGCGTGRPVALFLSEKGHFVTGIDISEKMIELAKNNNIPNADFQCTDFFDFETSDTFDGILAWDSFFHFPKNKQEMIYPKIAKMLKPDGYLLFTHGDIDDEHTSPMMGQEFYYSAITKEKIADLFLENGLEIEYMIKDFIEKDTDRGLVVLAKKI